MGLTRLLSSQLYAVSATDAFSFVLAAAVLVAAALLASALPSWRASRLVVDVPRRLQAFELTVGTSRYAVKASSELRVLAPADTIAAEIVF